MDRWCSSVSSSWSLKDEHAASHDECGYIAHYQHGQAVHLTYTAGKPAVVVIDA
jgi:hypothetical protein